MKERDPLALDFCDLAVSSGLTRRDLLQVLGGGVLVFVCVRRAGAQVRRGAGQRLPEDVNAFLHIGQEGRVRCFTGKIEMGQGVVTSLAQMLAEELEVELDAVDMVMGDTALCPWDMGTFGSMSTRFFGPPLRQAAAEARAILIELAAEELGVPVSGLRAEAGTVVVTDDATRRVAYAALAQGKGITRELHTEVELTGPEDFEVIGRSIPRKDGVEKVTGAAQFAADVRLPGMLYARLLRPPAHGAQLAEVDVSAAERLEGAVVVEQEGLVAVLHDDPERAEQGLALIEASWSVPDSDLDQETIYDHLVAVAPAADIAASGGDLSVGERQAVLTVERRYLNAYVAHAPMEPHAALARVDGDEATLWASTQTPFRLQSEAAEVLGLSEDKVRVITPFVGGGFGGKSANGQALEALRLARTVGRPVQVAWTREEEFFYDTFRPAAVVDVRAGVTSEGRIAFWDYDVRCAGERGSVQFYDIPHHRTAVRGSGWRGEAGTHPFATGAWRAPANNTNTFARESHIDALAAAAGIDPLEFRLANLADERMLRVLRAAAERFAWTPAQAPSGRGFGIALGIDAGTYVALLAEAEVSRESGAVRVKRVVCAQDMGLVINPEGARMQAEGCITMGLGYALSEEVRFRGGRVRDLSFGTYELPRFSWVPEIEVVLLDRRGEPAQGGGEPAIIGMGAAVANAVFDAVGARVLRLPMTPARVLAAL